MQPAEVLPLAETHVDIFQDVFTDPQDLIIFEPCAMFDTSKSQN